MTLFQLSYVLLWVLAILLVPTTAVLLYLLANLRAQVNREAAMGIKGHWLIGRSIAELPCREITSRKACTLGDFLGKENVVMGLSPTCGSCEVILNDLLSQWRDRCSEFTFVVLCMGEFHRCEAMVSDASLQADVVPLLAYDNMEDTDIFWVGWPAAIFVNETGAVVDVRHPPTIQALINTLDSGVYKTPTSAAPTTRSRDAIDATWNART